MAKIKSAIEEEPADSFTSMIDIVFLLLIFFILQPFKSPEMQMKSDLPQDSGPSSTPDTPRQNIAIYIMTGSEPNTATFKVDNTPTPPSGIAKHLKNKSGGDKETPIALMPDLTVSFKHVITALDQCYKAEMSDVKWNGPPLEGYKPKHLISGE